MYPGRVLLVENNAHLERGHFSEGFADFACGFVEAGCRIDVLTSRGWSKAGPAAFPLYRFGAIATGVDLVGERVARLRSRAAQRAGQHIRVIAMIGATRARRRRCAGPKPAVLLMSVSTNPMLVALLAGGGAWIVYQFTPSASSRRGRRGRFASAATRLAERSERRRRRGGGGVRIATPNESCRAAWDAAAPFLDPAVGPTAGCRAREPVIGAREELGLDTSESLALVYGFPHAEKDLEVVDRAFAPLEDWRLVVAGQMAVAYRKLPRLPRSGPVPILLPGHLDDTTVALLHSAADLAVLSFERGYERESGTLLEAITWGLPVVCSGESGPAETVRKYELGLIFEPGDADALARAVRSAPKRLDPAHLERARDELSWRAAATRYLRLFEEIERATGARAP